jgi:carboxymethylenebutenolidase
MEKIQIQLQHRNIDAYYFEAAGNRKRPGIIFLPDLAGVKEVNLQSAEILCKEGNYNIVIPDLYSGGTSLQKYCVQFLMNEMVRNNSADNNPPLAEFFELLDHFKTFDNVDEEQIGVIGQCLTGGFVLHAAIRREVKAPVVFHHSFGRSGSGMPKNCSALVENKIQGHFVYLDAFCPPNRIKQLKTELGDKLESYMYALPHGIPHLFFNTTQGKKAFDRMMTFFKSQLK